MVSTRFVHDYSIVKTRSRFKSRFSSVKNINNNNNNRKTNLLRMKTMNRLHSKINRNQRGVHFKGKVMSTKVEKNTFGKGARRKQDECACKEKGVNQISSEEVELSSVRVANCMRKLTRTDDENGVPNENCLLLRTRSKSLGNITLNMPSEQKKKQTVVSFSKKNNDLDVNSEKLCSINTRNGARKGDGRVEIEFFARIRSKSVGTLRRHKDSIERETLVSSKKTGENSNLSKESQSRNERNQKFMNELENCFSTRTRSKSVGNLRRNKDNVKKDTLTPSSNEYECSNIVKDNHLDKKLAVKTRSKSVENVNDIKDKSSLSKNVSRTRAEGHIDVAIDKPVPNTITKKCVQDDTIENHSPAQIKTKSIEHINRTTTINIRNSSSKKIVPEEVVPTPSTQSLISFCTKNVNTASNAGSSSSKTLPNLKANVPKMNDISNQSGSTKLTNHSNIEIKNEEADELKITRRRSDSVGNDFRKTNVASLSTNEHNTRSCTFKSKIVTRNLLKCSKLKNYREMLYGKTFKDDDDKESFGKQKLNQKMHKNKMKTRMHESFRLKRLTNVTNKFTKRTYSSDEKVCLSRLKKIGQLTKKSLLKPVITSVKNRKSTKISVVQKVPKKISTRIERKRINKVSSFKKIQKSAQKLASITKISPTKTVRKSLGTNKVRPFKTVQKSPRKPPNTNRVRPFKTIQKSPNTNKVRSSKAIKKQKSPRKSSNTNKVRPLKTVQKKTNTNKVSPFKKTQKCLRKSLTTNKASLFKKVQKSPRKSSNTNKVRSFKTVQKSLNTNKVSPFKKAQKCLRTSPTTNKVSPFKKVQRSPRKSPNINKVRPVKTVHKSPRTLRKLTPSQQVETPKTSRLANNDRFLQPSKKFQTNFSTISSIKTSSNNLVPNSPDDLLLEDIVKDLAVLDDNAQSKLNLYRQQKQLLDNRQPVSSRNALPLYIRNKYVINKHGRKIKKKLTHDQQRIYNLLRCHSDDSSVVENLLKPKEYKRKESLTCNKSITGTVALTNTARPKVNCTNWHQLNDQSTASDLSKTEKEHVNKLDSLLKSKKETNWKIQTVQKYPKSKKNQEENRKKLERFDPAIIENNHDFTGKKDDASTNVLNVFTARFETRAQNDNKVEGSVEPTVVTKFVDSEECETKNKNVHVLETDAKQVLMLSKSAHRRKKKVIGKDYGINEETSQTMDSCLKQSLSLIEDERKTDKLSNTKIKNNENCKTKSKLKTSSDIKKDVGSKGEISKDKHANSKIIEVNDNIDNEVEKVIDGSLQKKKSHLQNGTKYKMNVSSSIRSVNDMKESVQEKEEIDEHIHMYLDLELNTEDETNSEIEEIMSKYCAKNEKDKAHIEEDILEKVKQSSKLDMEEENIAIDEKKKSPIKQDKLLAKDQTLKGSNKLKNRYTKKKSEMTKFNNDINDIDIQPSQVKQFKIDKLSNEKMSAELVSNESPKKVSDDSWSDSDAQSVRTTRSTQSSSRKISKNAKIGIVYKNSKRTKEFQNISDSDVSSNRNEISNKKSTNRKATVEIKSTGHKQRTREFLKEKKTENEVEEKSISRTPSVKESRAKPDLCKIDKTEDEKLKRISLVDKLVKDDSLNARKENSGGPKMKFTTKERGQCSTSTNKKQVDEVIKKKTMIDGKMDGERQNKNDKRVDKMVEKAPKIDEKLEGCTNKDGEKTVFKNKLEQTKEKSTSRNDLFLSDSDQDLWSNDGGDYVVMNSDEDRTSSKSSVVYRVRNTSPIVSEEEDDSDENIEEFLMKKYTKGKKRSRKDTTKNSGSGSKGQDDENVKRKSTKGKEVKLSEKSKRVDDAKAKKRQPDERLNEKVGKTKTKKGNNLNEFSNERNEENNTIKTKKGKYSETLNGKEKSSAQKVHQNKSEISFSKDNVVLEKEEDNRVLKNDDLIVKPLSSSKQTSTKTKSKKTTLFASCNNNASDIDMFDDDSRDLIKQKLSQQPQQNGEKMGNNVSNVKELSNQTITTNANAPIDKSGDSLKSSSTVKEKSKLKKHSQEVIKPKSKDFKAIVNEHVNKFQTKQMVEILKQWNEDEHLLSSSVVSSTSHGPNDAIRNLKDYTTRQGLTQHPVRILKRKVCENLKKQMYNNAKKKTANNDYFQCVCFNKFFITRNRSSGAKDTGGAALSSDSGHKSDSVVDDVLNIKVKPNIHGDVASMSDVKFCKFCYRLYEKYKHIFILINERYLINEFIHQYSKDWNNLNKLYGNESAIIRPIPTRKPTYRYSFSLGTTTTVSDETKSDDHWKFDSKSDRLDSISERLFDSSRSDRCDSISERNDSKSDSDYLSEIFFKNMHDFDCKGEGGRAPFSQHSPYETSVERSKAYSHYKQKCHDVSVAIDRLCESSLTSKQGAGTGTGSQSSCDFYTFTRPEQIIRPSEYSKSELKLQNLNAPMSVIDKVNMFTNENEREHGSNVSRSSTVSMGTATSDPLMSPLSALSLAPTLRSNYEHRFTDSSTQVEILDCPVNEDSVRKRCDSDSPRCSINEFGAHHCLDVNMDNVHSNRENGNDNKCDVKDVFSTAHRCNSYSPRKRKSLKSFDPFGDASWACSGGKYSGSSNKFSSSKSSKRRRLGSKLNDIFDKYISKTCSPKSCSKSSPLATTPYNLMYKQYQKTRSVSSAFGKNLSDADEYDADFSDSDDERDDKLNRSLPSSFNKPEQSPSKMFPSNRTNVRSIETIWNRHFDDIVRRTELVNKLFIKQRSQHLYSNKIYSYSDSEQIIKIQNIKRKTFMIRKIVRNKNHTMFEQSKRDNQEESKWKKECFSSYHQTCQRKDQFERAFKTCSNEKPTIEEKRDAFTRNEFMNKRKSDFDVEDGRTFRSRLKIKRIGGDKTRIDSELISDVYRTDHSRNGNNGEKSKTNDETSRQNYLKNKIEQLAYENLYRKVIGTKENMDVSLNVTCHENSFENTNEPIIDEENDGNIVEHSQSSLDVNMCEENSNEVMLRNENEKEVELGRKDLDIVNAIVVNNEKDEEGVIGVMNVKNLHKSNDAISNSFKNTNVKMIKDDTSVRKGNSSVTISTANLCTERNVNNNKGENKDELSDTLQKRMNKNLSNTVVKDKPIQIGEIDVDDSGVYSILGSTSVQNIDDSTILDESSSIINENEQQNDSMVETLPYTSPIRETLTRMSMCSDTSIDSSSTMYKPTQLDATSSRLFAMSSSPTNYPKHLSTIKHEQRRAKFNLIHNEIVSYAQIEPKHQNNEYALRLMKKLIKYKRISFEQYKYYLSLLKININISDTYDYLVKKYVQDDEDSRTSEDVKIMRRTYSILMNKYYADSDASSCCSSRRKRRTSRRRGPNVEERCGRSSAESRGGNTFGALYARMDETSLKKDEQDKTVEESKLRKNNRLEVIGKCSIDDQCESVDKLNSVKRGQEETMDEIKIRHDNQNVSISKNNMTKGNNYRSESIDGSNASIGYHTLENVEDNATKCNQCENVDYVNSMKAVQCKIVDENLVTKDDKCENIDEIDATKHIRDKSDVEIHSPTVESFESFKKSLLQDESNEENVEKQDHGGKESISSTHLVKRKLSFELNENLQIVDQLDETRETNEIFEENEDKFESKKCKKLFEITLENDELCVTVAGAQLDEDDDSVSRNPFTSTPKLVKQSNLMDKMERCENKQKKIISLVGRKNSGAVDNQISSSNSALVCDEEASDVVSEIQLRESSTVSNDNYLNEMLSNIKQSPKSPSCSLNDTLLNIKESPNSPLRSLNDTLLNIKENPKSPSCSLNDTLLNIKESPKSPSCLLNDTLLNIKESPNSPLRSLNDTLLNIKESPKSPSCSLNDTLLNIKESPKSPLCSLNDTLLNIEESPKSPLCSLNDTLLNIKESPKSPSFSLNDTLLNVEESPKSLLCSLNDTLLNIEESPKSPLCSLNYTH